MVKKKIIGLRVNEELWNEYHQIRLKWRVLAQNNKIDEPDFSEDMRVQLRWALQEWEGRYYDAVERLKDKKQLEVKIIEETI